MVEAVVCRVAMRDAALAFDPSLVQMSQPWDKVWKAILELREGAIPVTEVDLRSALHRQGLSQKDITHKVAEILAADQVSKSEADRAVDYILQRSAATIIAARALDVVQGHGTLDAIEGVLERYRRGAIDDGVFFSASLKDLIEDVALSGIPWPLESFGACLGALPGGSLGHVFARPDVGKTAFVITMVAHLARLGIPTIWFNNEEAGSRLWLRYYCALCDATFDDLVNDPDFYEKRFAELGGYTVKLYDSAVITWNTLYNMVLRISPRVLLIDQADKIVLTRRDMSASERLKALYGAFRELAKKTGADVITVGQASAEAHGKQWLEYLWMDWSKTGKPGELDYIIGIGVTKDPNTRAIYVSKNKLTGSHDRWIVGIDPERSLYYDLGKK